MVQWCLLRGEEARKRSLHHPTSSNTSLGNYSWNDGSSYNGDWVDNKISGYVGTTLPTEFPSVYAGYRELISGLMGGSISAAGWRITCTVRGPTHGKTVGNTRACTFTIRSTATEFTPGRTGESTMGSGRKESSMATGSTCSRMAKRSMVSGKMAAG